MGEIVVGMVVGIVAFFVISVLFGLWRRHRKDEARPVEGLLVGLLVAAGGVFLMGLVVFVMPTVPVYDWWDIARIFLKVAILIAGAALALRGVGLAIASLGEMRTPRE